MLSNFKAGLCVSLFVLAVLALVLMRAPSMAQDKLLTFNDIEGTWKGFGWFYFTYGNKRRARCTAIIRAEGGPDQGRLDLNCVAGSLTIDANAFDIQLKGATATGKWAIPSFEVDGALTGTLTPDSLNAHLQPAGAINADYGATLNAKLDGTCRVALTQEINSPLDLKKLDLNLRRC